MKRIRLAVAGSGLLLAGSWCQTVLADEGRLTLPSRIGDPVRLHAPDIEADADPATLAERLQVFVGNSEACCAGRSPMAGRYEVDGSSLRFLPMFDFVEGQAYVVDVKRSDETNAASHQLTGFTIEPAEPAETPRVIGIYPSGDRLPENVLRFYIHFSTPMSPHKAFDHIKLVDADGHADEAAFMRFKQELWSEDRRRLTVLMDPGRIKRGVTQNVTLGPAMVEGRRYKLVVEGGWRAAHGAEPLVRYEKTFAVSKGLRSLPNVEAWEIEAPELHSEDPLEITFDRPFDAHLLRSDIKVVSKTGEVIDGDVVVDDHETAWRFQPSEAWNGETIDIVVDSELEDVAGNNFKDLLDHGVGTETKDISDVTISIDLGS